MYMMTDEYDEMCGYETLKRWRQSWTSVYS